MKIKVMIAEDEKLARKELEFMLKKFEDLDLCPSASNGEELLEKYAIHSPEVIFIDIQMPGIEGITVAQYLKTREDSPLLIFTTAYDQYAVEAFSLNAVDYLLKPFGEERLEEAVNRIRKEMKRNNEAKSDENNQANKAKQYATSLKVSKLLLEDGGKVSVVDPHSIYYVMRDERVVRIFTKNKEYQSKLTLQELEEKLLPFHFFRPHRSFLVNLQFVEEIIPWFNGAYNLTLQNIPKVKIPVSRSSAKELLKRLQM